MVCPTASCPGQSRRAADSLTTATGAVVSDSTSVKARPRRMGIRNTGKYPAETRLYPIGTLVRLPDGTMTVLKSFQYRGASQAAATTSTPGIAASRSAAVAWYFSGILTSQTPFTSSPTVSADIRFWLRSTIAVTINSSEQTATWVASSTL